MSFYARVSNALERIITWSSNLLLAWLTLSIFAAVVLRYLFHIGADWIFLIAQLSGVGLAYLMIGVVFRHDAHIKLTLITDRLGRRGRRFFAVFNDLVVLTFSVAFSYWSLKWILYSFKIGEESTELLGVSIGLFHMPMVVGGVFWVLYGIEKVIKDIISWREPEAADRMASSISTN